MKIANCIVGRRYGRLCSKRLDFSNSNSELVATGTTGSLLKAGVTSIKTVNSGPLGGDAEIGAMVSRGEINGVIFFEIL